jgi:hypothetical protein
MTTMRLPHFTPRGPRGPQRAGARLCDAAVGVLLSAALLLTAACGPGTAGGAPRLDADTLAAWQACIEPDAAELSFERIPWLPSYVEGVQVANAQRMPLLLWIMNGHPLGCT